MSSENEKDGRGRDSLMDVYFSTYDEKVNRIKDFVHGNRRNEEGKEFKQWLNEQDEFMQMKFKVLKEHPDLHGPPDNSIER